MQPGVAAPVLYSFRRCPYAMRARLALSTSGLPYSLREVALRSKPAELLAASAKGTVPVLVLPDGQVMDESLVIMRWALQQNDPERWLPDPGAATAEADALIAQNDGPFKRVLDRYKYPNRYPAESALAGGAAAFAAAHRQTGAAWLALLNGRLGSSRNATQMGWLLGERCGLADMALLPFVRQFAHTDRSWFAAQPWPALQAWLAGFEASALFDGVMGKVAVWVPVAPRLGGTAS